MNSLCVYHKQDIVNVLHVTVDIANDRTAYRGNVSDGIIAGFLLAIFFIVQFYAVIVKENPGSTAE